MNSNTGFSNNPKVTKIPSYFFPTAIFTYRVFPLSFFHYACQFCSLRTTLKCGSLKDKSFVKLVIVQDSNCGWAQLDGPVVDQTYLLGLAKVSCSTHTTLTRVLSKVIYSPASSLHIMTQGEQIQCATFSKSQTPSHLQEILPNSRNR